MARLLSVFPALIAALLCACGESAPAPGAASAALESVPGHDENAYEAVTPESATDAPVATPISPPSGWPLAVTRPEDAAVEYERVVLVTIDTLRADHVSAYGYPRATTPFLDSLAARGVLFERAMAAVSHTAPSHATMLTGLVPSVHGVLKNGNKLERDAVDLPKLFASAGFESAAFLNVRFLSGVARSFDYVDASLVSSKPGKPTGADVVDRASKWLRKQRKRERFFLWVHLYDPHGWNEDVNALAEDAAPLWKGATPDDFLATLAALHGLPAPGDDLEQWSVDWRIEHESRGVDLRKATGFQACIDAYDQRTLFADRQVARLYRALEGLGLGGRTLWILTSDHGEGLASHGVAGHGSRIYQEQLHVPLILHATDDSLGPRVVSELVGHVDLLPTLAETLDGRVRAHPRLFDGRSLWPLVRGEGDWAPRMLFGQRRPIETAASKGLYSLQDGEHKLIKVLGGKAEFYDLRSDPGELTNLGLADEDAARLSQALEARLLDYRGLEADADQAEVPEEWLQELKDLGYVR